MEQNPANSLPMPKTVHFLHIGKTGGSAIKDALKAGIRKQEKYKNIRNIKNHKKYSIRGFCEEYDQIKFHGHGTTLENIPDTDFFFFCIRHPINRYVSGFNSRLNQGRPRYNCPWTKQEQIAFSRFKTPSELAESLSSADIQDKNAALKAMQSIRHVRDPMTQWFTSYENLLKRSKRLICLCDQKNLSDDYEILLKRFKIKEEFRDFVELKLVHAASKTISKNLSNLAVNNLTLHYFDEISIYHRLLGLK